MKTPTIEASHKRWREILPALGVASVILNGKHQPCPACGGVDRFRFTDVRGDGDYFCSGCGAGKGLKLLQLVRGWDFAKAASEVDRIIGNLPEPKAVAARKVASVAELNALWLEASPVNDDDPVGLYLRNRGLSLHRSLKYHPRLLHYPTRTHHAGMLARLIDANGKPKQLHRTYLTEDGRKANVTPVRMFMPGDLPMGGAIRFGAAAGYMGIAEGIETALSVTHLFKKPCWATTSAGMLEAWVPPPEAMVITIFADADKSYTGQASAFKLAKRLVFEAQRDGIARTVDVRLPPLGQDWNDVHCEREDDLRKARDNAV
jgi:putative DNA primase/helicase